MKKLKRSTNNKTVSGVCGGIGEYFNVDPTIVRIIFIIAAFASLGTAILLYIILILLIPQDDGTIDV